jgi:hypothetical protein
MEVEKLMPCRQGFAEAKMSSAWLSSSLKRSPPSPPPLHDFARILPFSEPPWSDRKEKKSNEITPHQRRVRLLKKVSPAAPLRTDHLHGGLTKGTAGDRLALRRSTNATNLQRRKGRWPLFREELCSHIHSDEGSYHRSQTERKKTATLLQIRPRPTSSSISPKHDN